MIYDCFTRFNEVELLKFRFDYLGDNVDYFVISEGDGTYSNQPKSITFSTSLVPKRLREKIIYRYVALEDEGPWQRESFQRRVLAEGVTNAQPDDLILITDIDEIPNRKVLNEITNRPRRSIKLVLFKRKRYLFNKLI